MSARAPHADVTKFLLYNTFRSSTRRSAKDVPAPPDLTDEGLVTLGAQHYALVCSSCHGGPGLGQSPQALGMRPSPQSLPAVVDQFTDRELYVILRDGVRFSAMPAWPADSNFAEIWAVVAFLRQLPDISVADYAALTGGTGRPSGDAPEMPWGERGDLAQYDIHVFPTPHDEYLPAAPSTGWRPIGLDGAPVGTCARCHGPDGRGTTVNGQAPNIAIHSPDFIAQRLHDYANGHRASGMMAVVASSLSDSQIDALARFYGTSPDTAEAASDMTQPGSDTARGAGAQIALAGLPEKAVPSCGTCHSKSARAAFPLFPAIAGQNQPFLQRRLDSFAMSPLDDATGWNPMHAFARRMSDTDRQEVATFLAGLDPDNPLAPDPIAMPDGDTARTQVAQGCIMCHGSDMAGGVEGIAPNLTLQDPAYLFQQLTLFHGDLRRNELMSGIAHRDSLSELAILAEWIGDFDPAPSTARPTSTAETEAEIARAETIARNGLPENGVPACLSCHGASGPAMIPKLHGQSETYLAERLNRFARPDATQISPMSQVASGLGPKDIDALAHYFAAQDPLEK